MADDAGGQLSGECTVARLQAGFLEDGVEGVAEEGPLANHPIERLFTDR